MENVFCSFYFLSGICFGILGGIMSSITLYKVRVLKLVNTCFLLNSITPLLCCRKSDSKSPIELILEISNVYFMLVRNVEEE